MASMPCPCQSGKTFGECCSPVISGEQAADSAEALMRSRYTAFTLCNDAYLLASWHASTRPTGLDLAGGEPTPKWIGLQVRQHVQTGKDSAIVEFVARYRINGKAHRLHETSRFVREGHRWYYVDGDIQE